MKKIISLLILSICFTHTLVNSAEIKVDVVGVVSLQGNLVIGLFNHTDNFPSHDMAYKGVILKATNAELSYVFNDIPAGTYAIAVYHDENSNAQLDSNFIGIPKEGYALSNAPKGRFGPPEFEDSTFNVDDKKQLTLPLIY